MESASTQTPESARPPQPHSIGAGVGSGRAPLRGSKWGKKFLFAMLGIALIVVAVLLYQHYAAWESTDDAEIDGYIYPVSSRVSGYVTRVMVDDNQYVER